MSAEDVDDLSSPPRVMNTEPTTNLSLTSDDGARRGSSGEERPDEGANSGDGAPINAMDPSLLPPRLNSIPSPMLPKAASPLTLDANGSPLLGRRPYRCSLQEDSFSDLFTSPPNGASESNGSIQDVFSPNPHNRDEWIAAALTALGSSTLRPLDSSGPFELDAQQRGEEGAETTKP